MNCKLVLVLTLAIIICVDGKKSLSGRSGSSSARGSSRRTSYNPHPAPTSLSYPQPSAPKPSLFGWQEKTSAKQPKPKNTQTHSYPSSQTGLSGSGTNQAKSPSTNQESIQRSAPQNTNSQAATGVSRTNNQASHSYPASTGLSGSPGSGYPQSSGSGTAHQPGYPQQTGSGISHQQGSSYPQQPGSGLSGSGAAAPPPYSGAAAPPSYAAAGAPPPYSGYKPGASYPNNNYGNNYQHPAPPPPYSNYGSNYGGHPSYHSNNGAPMPGYSPQSPGFFGNYGSYGNNRGMSRSGSALTGVGIAGAGVGTLLTGLALWNLARSTGNRHHTVVYDNRGQPVAVAPENGEQTEANAMLADLVNCSLTINKDEKSEILAIPCAIATSFTPDADVKTSENGNIESDNTKCIVTVVNKSGKEYMTTIPCSILLNTAAENNVTEPPISMDETVNATMVIPTQSPVINPIQPSPVIDPNQPLPVIDPNQASSSVIDPNQPPALSLTSAENGTGINCTSTPQPGEIRDPINPCYSISHNLTVVPLPTTQPIANTDKVGQ